MNTTSTRRSLRTARRFAFVAAIAAVGIVTLAAPHAEAGNRKPAPIAPAAFKPLRWMTVDGGSIDSWLAMDIAAHGGNPNTVPTGGRNI